jgi:hypothetical protein
MWSWFRTIIWFRSLLRLPTFASVGFSSWRGRASRPRSRMRFGSYLLLATSFPFQRLFRSPVNSEIRYKNTETTDKGHTK